jgi:hypothetical protein
MHFLLDAFSACASAQICYPAHMMQRESKMPKDFVAELKRLGINQADLDWVQANFYNWFCPDWSEQTMRQFKALAKRVVAWAKVRGE